MGAGRGEVIRELPNPIDLYIYASFGVCLIGKYYLELINRYKDEPYFDILHHSKHRDCGQAGL